MTKHTPGPWVSGWGKGLTGPTYKNIDGATVAGPDWYSHPVSREGETIAICPNQVSDYGPEQVDGSGEANARLIAAAPEMYEALIVLTGALAVHAPHLQISIRIGEAAIAKAEGTQS